MIVVRWIWMMLVLAVAQIGGLAAPALADAHRLASGFVLERDLAGRSVGTGYFTNILGQRRDFSVDFNGRVEGNTLVLGEVIRFKDGAVERYTWRFTKTGAGTYTGTREGVVGSAVGTTEGNLVRLEYTADVRGTDGNVTRLRFDDELIRRRNGQILNRATAYLFGIPVGWVNIVIDPVRASGRAGH